MGCDIHCFAEVKINGRWEHYGEIRIFRNYALFSQMADCGRGVERPISNNKGLPNDITFLTKYHRERWGGDGHSDSWFSPREVGRLFAWAEDDFAENFWRFELEQTGFLFGSGWADFEKYSEDRPAGLEDFRWVFWFDS
jgi:hypothetical protein